jgi:hypothetical protein
MEDEKESGKKSFCLISLYSGPGSGKSTGAAWIFAKLKLAGVNAELVTEFAKDKVWEKNEKALANQAYVFGKQYFRLSRLEGEVECVVTDSPLLLGVMYNRDPRLGEEFNKVVARVSKSIGGVHLDYFVKRVKPYNPKGRLQTEDESDEISEKIKKLLDVELGVGKWKEIPGNESGYQAIVNDVLNVLNKSHNTAF